MTLCLSISIVRSCPRSLSFVLHPRGGPAGREWTAPSPRAMEGSTRIRVDWRTIELWTIPAEDLLAAGDVGLIPWVPLASYAGPPEPIFRECRERIERDAPPGELENLLAVTQFLSSLRYNDPRLFEILGGRQAMIESPAIQESIADPQAEELVDPGGRFPNETNARPRRELTDSGLQLDLGWTFGSFPTSGRDPVRTPPYSPPPWTFGSFPHSGRNPVMRALPASIKYFTPLVPLLSQYSPVSPSIRRSWMFGSSFPPGNQPSTQPSRAARPFRGRRRASPAR